MKPPATAAIAYPIRLASQHLKACGVGPDCSVTLAGRVGLSAQLWLCRHDYSSVNHVTGEAGGSERAQIVLLTDLVAPEAVGDAVRRARRHLAEGGWLVTWSKDPMTADDPVHETLRELGFDLVRCVRRAGGELHLARLAAPAKVADQSAAKIAA